MKSSLNIWLLVLAAVFLASWYFGRPTDRATNQEPTVAVAPAVQEQPREYGVDLADRLVHLRVLNGTVQPGLARDFSLLLGRAGCVAESVDNAPHDRFETTLLVNRRLDDRQAKDLAHSLGGVRVLREWDGRTTEDAVLVLGRDHARVRDDLRRATAQVK